MLILKKTEWNGDGKITDMKIILADDDFDIAAHCDDTQNWILVLETRADEVIDIRKSDF